MHNQNPLQNYFRSVKMYISLPSGTSYYTPDILEFNDSGEVAIYPMTAKDELLIKNPDALLNGDAIIDIVKSCVPNVKDPKKLLSNDIDAMLIAIRHASYGEDIDLDAVCPECDANNHVSVNMTQSLSGMEYLEKEYFISLPNGIYIYVKPFSYAEVVKGLQAQFEQYKLAQALDNDDADDMQKLKVFNKSFKKLANLNFELLSNCIIKVTNEGAENEAEFAVTDKKHILEFLQNVEKETFAALDNLVKKINNIGVRKHFEIECAKCEHTWEANLDFNPVTFFTKSS